MNKKNRINALRKLELLHDEAFKKLALLDEKKLDKSINPLEVNNLGKLTETPELDDAPEASVVNNSAGLKNAAQIISSLIDEISDEIFNQIEKEQEQGN